ncbi:hypothetical protein J7I84_14675 [Arthrobacter sp. ISL-85]|nr:hypothetical protein [Arthrobacter sp. ISL-85]MBT2567721.1 hypothetical protein [Arthrobacter sp. ISL-85]
MSSDDEKDPPVPADVEGKIPKKVHDEHAATKPVAAQGDADPERTN